MSFLPIGKLSCLFCATVLQTSKLENITAHIGAKLPRHNGINIIFGVFYVNIKKCLLYISQNNKHCVGGFVSHSSLYLTCIADVTYIPFQILTWW